MKSLSKKSAKGLLSGMTALILTCALAGCTQSAEQPELEKTTDASLIEAAEYIPASEDGPAQNVPEPRMSLVATENSEKGAEAAFQFFVEALDFARMTGTTEALESISGKACEFCQDNITHWHDIYGDGDWVVSDGELTFEMVEGWSGYDDELDTSVAELIVDLYQPASQLYENGEMKASDSVDTDNVSKWHVSLIFDGTSQRWELEWMYLVERDTQESQ